MARRKRAKSGSRNKSGGPSTAAERLDVEAVKAAKPVLKHPLVRALGTLGNIGDQPPLLALSGAVLAFGLVRRDARLSRAGTRMIAAHLLATAVKKLGKDFVDRTRPAALIDEGHYRMEPGGDRRPELRSFPSGHTAGAVAIARAAAREFPERKAIFYSAATVIGILQVPRQAHFPTDVAAGALIGVGAEGSTHALFEAVVPQRH